MDNNEPRWRVPLTVWVPLLIFGGLLYFLDVFQIQYYTISKMKIPSSQLLTPQDQMKGFVVKTPGCRIPDMNPMDSSIKKFIFKPKPPICNEGIPALYESNLTHITLLNSSLIHYNISDLSELKCCYRNVTRRKPRKKENDDKIDTGKICINFKAEGTEIKQEFIEVTCAYLNSTVYMDLFAFVPSKIKPTVAQEKRSKLNVLVIGLDAVSRLNLHRQLPKTVKYLKELNAIELMGYNKVGDNTFPNLIPVLTGMYENELRNNCWPHDGDRFDDCPFIWKNYKKNGFVTSFGEDSSWMGIFNYQRKGFSEQPTDYAYGYFNRISEKKIGNSHNMNVYECIGARDIYKDFLEYIYRFCTRMYLDNTPYFAFNWGSSLSHDYLNKPTLGDNVYQRFFQTLKKEKLLDNTAVIFMSDHGIRWGQIRQTFQGRMEERLPFVYMVLPKWFRIEHKEAYHNLEQNVHRLTTPFDLHETLKDLIDPSLLTNTYLQEKSLNKSLGYSFFSDISKKRTCEDAGIESHWCTCQQSTELDVNNNTIVNETAKFAVKHMNDQLKGYMQCANLILVQVNNARLMSHGDHMFKDDNNILDYTLTLRTQPGDGVFEVTVRHHKVKKKFEVMGTISRLNLYGKQSACITDFHLKLYCYCKNLLTENP